MDCDYLLVYGEGLLRDQSHFQFHAATLEDAEKNAEEVVKVRRQQARRPDKFSAQLYRQMKEWR